MDAQSILQDDAIAFGCTIIAYTCKSGFEHSKWATPREAIVDTAKDHPIATAAVSGLMSSGGNPLSAVSSAVSEVQKEATQAALNQGNAPDQGTNNNMAG